MSDDGAGELEHREQPQWAERSLKQTARTDGELVTCGRKTSTRKTQLMKNNWQRREGMYLQRRLAGIDAEWRGYLRRWH